MDRVYDVRYGWKDRVVRRAAAGASLPKDVVTEAAVGFGEVLRAAERLRGVANRTPVLASRTLDAETGTLAFLKCENFQRMGAFKFRGAYNRLSLLAEDERRRGVVAFSSGNHAQGVALAASLLQIRATIVMPTDAPAAKLAATRGYGADVILYDRRSEDRTAIAVRVARETGATVVPPFDDPAIIAGAGTVALELLEEVGGLDAVLVPLGGGGLLSGSAIAARGMGAGLSLWGVEPETGDDFRRSLSAGYPIETAVPETIADGLRTRRPGDLTFPIVRALCAGVVTVSDDELRDAV
ncbi:MAG: pyridoxal-phosphate dependent enzyme, partial [Candidatus Eremiobacteraeota bacterium]|nr:pyridoxal-phosphate dependent enzyme [Candidatus Eremiobacteraeota bacterium]